MYLLFVSFIDLSFSFNLFRQSILVFWKYPSNFGYVILFSVLAVLFDICFIFLTYETFHHRAHWVLYIYLGLSFYWVNQTFSYIIYSVSSGMASIHYLLSHSEFSSKSPVWRSFKSSITTSFGSIAYAGLFLNFVSGLRSLTSIFSTSQNPFSVLLKCTFSLCFCIFENVIRVINKNGLIYCSMFGVPYRV